MRLGWGWGGVSAVRYSTCYSPASTMSPCEASWGCEACSGRRGADSVRVPTSSD